LRIDWFLLINWLCKILMIIDWQLINRIFDLLFKWMIDWIFFSSRWVQCDLRRGYRTCYTKHNHCKLVFFWFFWTVFELFLGRFSMVFGPFFNCFWTVFQLFLDRFSIVVGQFFNCFWTVFQLFLNRFWIVFGPFFNCMILQRWLYRLRSVMIHEIVGVVGRH